MYPETLSRIVNSSEISEEDKNLLEYWLGQIKETADSDSHYAEELRGISTEIFIQCLRQRGKFLQAKHKSDANKKSPMEFAIDELIDYVYREGISNPNNKDELISRYSRMLTDETRKDLADEIKKDLADEYIQAEYAETAYTALLGQETDDGYKTTVGEIARVLDLKPGEIQAELQTEEGKRQLAQRFGQSFKIQDFSEEDLNFLLAEVSTQEANSKSGKNLNKSEIRGKLIEYYYPFRLRQLSTDELGERIRTRLRSDVERTIDIGKQQSELYALARSRDYSVRARIAGFEHTPDNVFCYLAEHPDIEEGLAKQAVGKTGDAREEDKAAIQTARGHDYSVREAWTSNPNASAVALHNFAMAEMNASFTEADPYFIKHKEYYDRMSGYNQQITYYDGLQEGKKIVQQYEHLLQELDQNPPDGKPRIREYYTYDILDRILSNHNTPKLSALALADTISSTNPVLITDSLLDAANEMLEKPYKAEATVNNNHGGNVSSPGTRHPAEFAEAKKANKNRNLASVNKLSQQLAGAEEALVRATRWASDSEDNSNYYGINLMRRYFLNSILTQGSKSIEEGEEAVGEVEDFVSLMEQIRNGARTTSELGIEPLSISYMLATILGYDIDCTFEPRKPDPSLIKRTTDSHKVDR